MTIKFLDILQEHDFRKAINYQVRKYQTGELILEEGIPSKEVLVILSGTVGAYSSIDHLGLPGHWTELASFSVGDVIGELTLFDQAARAASVAASSDCEIAVISSQALTQFMDENPGLGYRILKDIIAQTTQRLRKANNRNVEIIAHYMDSHPARSI